MKQVMLLIVIAAYGTTVSARILRVNNNPGVLGTYQNPQTAHNEANAGDTIHIEPSPTIYSGVTCNKPLVWLSVGAFLTNNPGLQFSTVIGQISSMDLNPGSEGSVVSVHTQYHIGVNTNNISVHRSSFSELNANHLSANFSLTQSFSPGHISVSGTNMLIANCILGRLYTGSGSSGVISNNVITEQATHHTGSIYNSVFQNNISCGFTFNFFNSTATHNMTRAGHGLPADPSNQFNVDMFTVFENFGGNVDKDYKLKAGAPALGSGYNGVDMGAFGGANPFVLGLQPAIPAITQLNAPAVNNTGTINATFSAKTNQ